MSGPQCFKNPPSISAGSAAGAGQVQVLAGIKSYIAGSSDSELAILFISDAFGYEPPNLRKLADEVAAAGYLVIVPDFLYCDPANPSSPNFTREAWMDSHSPDKGCADAKSVIAALKAKVGVRSIGAAGFCWGGMVLAKLAGSDDIQAAVILHPGEITEEEIRAVKIPIAILGAEIDHYSPPDVLRKFGDILSAKSELEESYVKIFPGVSHGWSVRYDLEDESAVRSAEEAHRDMLEWFRKHVK